jgi:hypothetical protein
MAKRKAVKCIDLHEEIRNAILKACADDDDPRRTMLRLFYAGVASIGTRVVWLACEQEARDLIASGRIVKVKGVYRVAHIGGPDGEE